MLESKCLVYFLLLPEKFFDILPLVKENVILPLRDLGSKEEVEFTHHPHLRLLTQLGQKIAYINHH